MYTLKNQQSKELRAKAVYERRQASNVRTERNKLTPEERNFLRQKFSMHAARGTLLAAEIKAAMADKTFEKFFNAIKERETLEDPNLVIKLLQSSFRSMFRQK